jgi:hypothetical protein
LARVLLISVNPELAEVLRSILKPVSSSELSVQDKSILELEAAVACRLVGAFGGFTGGAGVVALATLE